MLELKVCITTPGTMSKTVMSACTRVTFIINWVLGLWDSESVGSRSTRGQSLSPAEEGEGSPYEPTGNASHWQLRHSRLQ